MVQRLRVRPISDEEGNRLLRIVRRSSGSVVTWRRAQMVLLSAHGMPVAKIAEVTFTRPDWVRDVLHNSDTDGLNSLPPAEAKYFPSFENVTEQTQSLCGFGPGCSFPVARSSINPLPDQVPSASSLPSGEKASPRAAFVFA